MMTVFRADWVLPIAGPPIRGGCVGVEDGRIVSVGNRPPAGARDLGCVAVLPSLVNAHTHLELSYLRDRVPPACRFTDWIRPLMAARRSYPDPEDREILAAAETAIASARASGTGLLGEVTNTLVTPGLLQKAGMPAHVFFELLGFNAPDPGGRVRAARERADRMETDGWPVALAAHAPYSVSPELFGAIRSDLNASPGSVTTVHLGESPEEVELLADGTGDLRSLLEELGAWNGEWRPPGVSPVAYLRTLGFLDSRVIAVHGVQFSAADLRDLRELAATVVSCPRSNLHVGVGEPPLAAFYDAGVTVAFGTDSLASVEDLNLFQELASARRVAPGVPASALLESATRCGARALGFGDELGSIEVGKRASLIAVRLPERSTEPVLRSAGDVEEYLMSGIEPDAITWLE